MRRCAAGVKIWLACTTLAIAYKKREVSMMRCFKKKVGHSVLFDLFTATLVRSSRRTWPFSTPKATREVRMSFEHHRFFVGASASSGLPFCKKSWGNWTRSGRRAASQRGKGGGGRNVLTHRLREIASYDRSESGCIRSARRRRCSDVWKK